MIRDMDINHPHEPYTKARYHMIGIWNKKDKVIQELHESRTAFALHYSPDYGRDVDSEHSAMNLRIYRAIEAVEELLKDKEQEVKDLHTVLADEKVPDAAHDSHPYFRLYRLEYHRHLATKKQMSGANGEMQRKIQVYEDAVTSLKRTLERV